MGSLIGYLPLNIIEEFGSVLEKRFGDKNEDKNEDKNPPGGCLRADKRKTG